ncbi:MAG: hypothetical protein LBS50_08195 [Prevotellaceae bacterium]|jgi:hypothetical protein|nr:hypothetical protein [Prevotellaceae bacterium]
MKVISFQFKDNADRLKTAELIRKHYASSNAYETTDTDGFWIHIPENYKDFVQVKNLCLSHDGEIAEYATIKH